MFDSGISAKTLISELQDNLDVALPIPETLYISWLNELEQFLYTEIIKEQNECNAIAQSAGFEKPVLPIEDTISIAGLLDPGVFEDLIAVYADDIQLIKTTLASSETFSDCYYKVGEKIGYKTKAPAQKIRFIYLVRPKLKTKDNIEEEKVMLPPEFVSLARAKLSGEAYKWVNEDAIAAKWLNDYNVLLETFKQWMVSKQPRFGWRV